MARPRAARVSRLPPAVLLTFLALVLPSPVTADEAGDKVVAEVAALQLGLLAAAAESASSTSEASVRPSPSSEMSTSGTPTGAATAAWATKTAGGMEQYSDANDTVVLHGDGSITYSCPNAGDKWTVEQLTDSLSAHTATGAGCKMEYAFTGDSVQIYGATGSEGGVFGCSVNTAVWNATGWWNGYGTTNTYKPYQGSCMMQGLGWDRHTIQLVNSPYQPGKVYFTGLRFTTNKTQQIWETHSWAACCAGYTFPDGVATTVAASPSASASATGSAGGGVAGMSSGTTVFVVCGLGAVIILASLLIACMCCTKRPAAGNAGTQAALKAALHGSSSSDSESRPLKRKKSHASSGKRGTKRRSSSSRRSTDDESRTSESTSASGTTGTDTGGSEAETSDEKRGSGRKRRGRR